MKEEEEEMAPMVEKIVFTMKLMLVTLKLDGDW